MGTWSWYSFAKSLVLPPGFLILLGLSRCFGGIPLGMSLSLRTKLMGSHELKASLMGLEKAGENVAFNSSREYQMHERLRECGQVGEPA